MLTSRAKKMNSLRNLLLVLVLSGVLASGVLTAVSMAGAHSATDAAQQALVSKDVIADILPPPMYLIELRLVLSQAVEGALPLATAQSEVNRLQKEYEARVVYWKDNPPYGLQAQLLGKQHADGEHFIVSAKAVMA